MQKLVVSKIVITYILESLVAQSLKGRNTTTHSVMLMKCFAPPTRRLTAFNHGFEAMTLISLWNLHTSPIQKSGWEI